MTWTARLAVVAMITSAITSGASAERRRWLSQGTPAPGGESPRRRAFSAELEGDSLRLRQGGRSVAEGRIRDVGVADLERTVSIDMRVRGVQIGAARQRARRALADAYLEANPATDRVLVPMGRGFEAFHRDANHDCFVRVAEGIAEVRGAAASDSIYRAALDLEGVTAVRHGDMTFSRDAVRYLFDPEPSTVRVVRFHPAGPSNGRQVGERGRSITGVAVVRRGGGPEETVRVTLRARTVLASQDASGARHEMLSRKTRVHHPNRAVRDAVGLRALAELLPRFLHGYSSERNLRSVMIARGRGGGRQGNVLSDQSVLFATRSANGQGNSIRIDSGERRRVVPDDPTVAPGEMTRFWNSIPRAVADALVISQRNAPHHPEVHVVDTQSGVTYALPARPAAAGWHADRARQVIASRERLRLRRSELERQYDPSRSAELDRLVQAGDPRWLSHVNTAPDTPNCTRCATATVFTLLGTARAARGESYVPLTSHGLYDTESVGLPTLQRTRIAGAPQLALPHRGNHVASRVDTAIRQLPVWTVGTMHLQWVGGEEGGGGHALNFVHTPRGPLLLDAQAEIAYAPNRGGLLGDRFGGRRVTAVSLRAHGVIPEARRPAVTALVTDAPAGRTSSESIPATADRAAD